MANGGDIGDTVFLAWAVTDTANRNAQEQIQHNRVNAFIQQGMTYEQAVAAAQHSFAVQAANTPPARGSISAIVFGWGWFLFFISAATMNGWAGAPNVIIALASLLGAGVALVAHHSNAEYRRWRARRTA